MTKKTEQMPIICNTITMSNPHVRWIGGSEAAAAIISYVRLDQSMRAEDSGPVTKTMSETRIWENRNGKLVNVHFHKS